MIEIREPSREEIKSILTDPEIYDRITDDDCPSREDYEFSDPFGSQYFGGYVDGRLIGVVIHHDGEIHVNILKDFRREHKSELLREALKRIDRDEVRAEIPSLFPSIIQFAKDEGFREERIVKDGYRKNGKTYDTLIMVKRCHS